MLSRRLRMVFAGPRWRVRRATYSSIAFLIVAFTLSSQYVPTFSAQSDVAQLRAFLYSMIVLFEGVGALNIRYGYGYGYAYKVEKLLGAVGFTGLSASAATGLSGTTFSLFCWFIVIVIAKVTAFEWIVSRNAILDVDGLRTALGRIPPPRTREEVIVAASTAASYARHDFLEAEDREELLEALGAPPISEWASAMRARLYRRRDRASELQAAGIDVEAKDLDPNDETSWPKVPK